MSAVQRAAPRRYRLREVVEPEHGIQRQVAQTFRLEIGPEAKVSPHGVTWFCIDHAQYGGAQPGVRVGRGIPSGIFDCLVLWQGRAFWIELKSRDGTLSEPQRSMAATLLLSGCRIGVARDADECLACLDEWQIPRAHRVRMAERQMRVAGGVA